MTLTATKAKFGCPKLTIKVPPVTGTRVPEAGEQTELSSQEVGKPSEPVGIEKQLDPVSMNEEKRVESLVQEAQVAVDKQGDTGPAFENGVSDLTGTLKSIVDVLVDKVDALAEVCLNFDTSPLYCSYSLTVSMISSTPTLILPGRHALHCIG